MRSKLMYGLVPLACIALAACGGKGKEPTGQVAAVVDGDEITVAELRAELADAKITDPKARKAAEQQALQMIVNRKIIAKAAQEQKLDKTPEFALQEQRAMDSLLANTLQKKIVDSVPAPTRAEAERYIAANPNIFGERKFFILDQIRIQRPTNAAMMKEFEPLKTFEEVEAMLKAKGIRYQRGTDTLDAPAADPRLVNAIVALPPQEVFVMPAGQLVLINRVRETRVVPFTGEPAIKYAMERIKMDRTRDAVGKQFTSLVKAAEGDVRYNAEYKPAPPKAPAGKAPAAKAQPKV